MERIEKINIDKYKRPKRLVNIVDGVPIPYTEMVLPKSALDDVLLAALSLPYIGQYCPIEKCVVLEDEFLNLTNMEVAAIKTARKAASGQTEDFRFVLERLLGKPKQQVENTNVNVSLAEYLKALDMEVPFDINTLPNAAPTNTATPWDFI